MSLTVIREDGQGPRCPACQGKLNAYTSLSEDGPPPRCGDYSICDGCVTLLIFATIEPVSYRCATDAERAQFAAFPEGQAALALMAAVRDMRAQHNYPHAQGGTS